MRAAHPELDAANVVNRIIATARPASSTVPDPLYGYGLVGAAAAVRASVPAVTGNPLGSLSEWITVHRRAEGPALESALPAPRPAIGKAIATGFGMLGLVLGGLEAVIPALVVLAGTMTALAALAAAAVVRFVTRPREE